MFVEELGLEPTPRLRQLEQAILRQDPDLDIKAAPDEHIEETTATPHARRQRPLFAAAAVAAAAAAGGGVALVSLMEEGGRGLAGIKPNAVGIVKANSGKISGAVAIGVTPTQIATGHGVGVWATSFSGHSVWRLDPATRTIRQTIRVGSGPTGIAVGNGAVWVANRLDGTVSRISPETNGVVQTIHVGKGPTAVAVGGGSVWVANTADRTLSRVDLRRRAVTATKLVGGEPTAIASGDGRIWVADESAAALDEIDPETAKIVRRIRLGSRPSGIALLGEDVWVSAGATRARHVGGVLRGVGLAMPPSLDPAINGLPDALTILAMTNDGLTALRKVGAGSGVELVPDLALSLPLPTPDGKTYSFVLRPGVRYSTGELVRATDVRSSLERLFKVRSPGTSIYSGIVGARGCAAHPKRCDLSTGVVADDTAGSVTFHLTRPDDEFLYKLALSPADVLPSGTPSRDIKLQPLPATGPYQLAPHQLKQQVKLVRNPFFREWSAAAQPRGFPDEIVLRFGLSDRQMVSAVVGVRADFMLAVPGAGLTELQKEHPGQLHSDSQPVTRWVNLNTRVAPFDHVRARRALNYAVDRNLFIARFGGPLVGRPTCQILPPNFPGYEPYCPYTRSPTRSGRWRGPDLVRARRLVAASGTSGMRVIVWSDKPGVGLGMGYVAALLSQLGYRATVKVVPPSMLVDSRPRLAVSARASRAGRRSAGQRRTDASPSRPSAATTSMGT